MSTSHHWLHLTVVGTLYGTVLLFFRCVYAGMVVVVVVVDLLLATGLSALWLGEKYDSLMFVTPDSDRTFKCRLMTFFCLAFN